MQIRFSIAALSALCLVAGCSGGGSAPTPPSSTNTVASNSSPTTTTPSAPASQPSTTAKKPNPSEATSPPTTKPVTPATGTSSVATPTTPTKPPESTKTTSTAQPNTDKSGAPIKDTGWYLVGKSPVDIGNDVDTMIKGLDGVQVNIDYIMTMATGSTSGHLVDKVRNSKVYSLQYPVVVVDPKRGVVSALAWVKSSGNTVTTRVDRNTVKRPLGPRPGPPSLDLVQSWPKDANREVFAGLVDQREPFSEYIKALLDKKSGYTVKVQERKQPLRGKLVDQYMIVAVRNPSAAKALGESSVFIVVDARIHLPVTIRATIKKEGAPMADSLKWDAQWVNHQKFDDGEFQSP
jgi:hypothetical protein